MALQKIINIKGLGEEIESIVKQVKARLGDLHLPSLPHHGGGHTPPADGHDKAIYKSLKGIEGRSPDGHGNNLAHPEWGAVGAAFVRIADDSYADGIGALPSSLQSPNPLPTPRSVTNAVMAQPQVNGEDIDIPNSFGTNEYLQFFGQFLTHDIVETNPFGSDAPIFGVAGLPFPFVRSAYELDENGVRAQHNEETSFLDLTSVYGSNQAMLDLLRADLPDGTQSAKLLTGVNNLLPTFNEIAANTVDPNDTGASVLNVLVVPGTPGAPSPDEYAAGDNRVDQQLPLATHHTVWMREHNYQVDKLAELFPHWSQEQLFQAARAVVEAEWQYVVYHEYLPHLLGPDALSPYTGYDPNVDPSIINEFTTAAFRFGHDQSSNLLSVLGEDGSDLGSKTLAQAFSFVVAATTTTDIDAWIRGQLSQYTQEIDGKVVESNRDLLFNIGNGNVTVDLEVFDIARGRDHGVSDYNAVRKALGLTEYSSFDEFGAANGVNADTLSALKTLYFDDIGRLDTIVGGLLEAKVPGSQLGETFHTLTVMQFEALRDGDRFYFENRFADNPALLAEIKSVTLAEIIERTTGIDHVYHDAFAAHERIGGTDGIDAILGTDGKDLMIGFAGNDDLSGEAGNDDLFGDAGRDVLKGGYGYDILNGGAGNDRMTGGQDGDIFVLEQGTGYDVVTDFDVKEDKLDLRDFGFACQKDVLESAFQVGQNTVIQLDAHAGDQVQLVGVQLCQLTADNVIVDGGYDVSKDYV